MSCSSNVLSASPIVINTRPVERAAPLTCLLQAAGLTVVDMPMLALQPRPVTDADIAVMRQWLAGNYQALVIVSPTAAAAGLAVWQTLEQEKQTEATSQSLAEKSKIPSPLIAVGEATAAVLQAAHYQVRQPTVANNEGMLAMPEIERLQAGDKLLVWRGLGGRRLLVDTLQARGVHIDSIAWYERTLPADANLHYQQWQQHFRVHTTQLSRQAPPPKPMVIISSGTAFEHWISAVSQAQSKFSDSHSDKAISLTLSDFTYIVLGERLANKVAEQQLSYWRVEDLAPETILTAINLSHGI
ncbi:uroporphyrinogen-III synthase [Psychrobacter sp. CAL346-MNA-CIBAN-0220]|uniref:uroporphyrinogen-III synthase n=1 Tax=Psychrobacter sp. CAL346-MNA-CIBAN-0220 TaxID=3140457 RepID=UPI003325CABC